MAAAAAATCIASPARAEHCNGTVRTLSGPTGSLYMDDRTATGGGVWMYVESNGAVGLQSGGASVVGIADPCAHDSPDTLLFGA